MNETFAQILGFLAIVVTVFSLQFNKKKKILTCQITSNSLYLVQYLLLGAFTASAASLVAVFRGLIFYYYDKNKKQKSKGALLFLITCLAIMTFLTYKDCFSIVALVASSVFTFGIWQNDLKTFRRIAVFVPILWFVYNWYVGAYISMFASCMEFISALVAIYRLDLKHKVKL